MVYERKLVYQTEYFCISMLQCHMSSFNVWLIESELAIFETVWEVVVLCSNVVIIYQKILWYMGRSVREDFSGALPLNLWYLLHGGYIWMYYLGHIECMKMLYDVWASILIEHILVKFTQLRLVAVMRYVIRCSVIISKHRFN